MGKELCDSASCRHAERVLLTVLRRRICLCNDAGHPKPYCKLCGKTMLEHGGKTMLKHDAVSVRFDA